MAEEHSRADAADDDEQALRVERDERGVATVTLSRPQVRNAFDDRLVDELRAAAEQLAGDDAVRAVVLTGDGSAFSAGADLEWMRAMREWSREDNARDAQRMEAAFGALDRLPKPLVGRINGPALGGGAGLVAVCDVVVADRSAEFGFPEVRLGLAPAVIAPYVVRKIGLSTARAVFLTGERLGAEAARDAGLVHHVAEPDELDAEVEAVLRRLLKAGPDAAAAVKRLVRIAEQPPEQAGEQTAALIAELRVGDEGQEGMAAFLARRPPAWAEAAGPARERGRPSRRER